MNTELMTIKTEVEPKTKDMQEETQAIQVRTHAEAEAASALRNAIKEGIDQITKKLAPSKKRAHEAHRAICALEKELLAPWQAAEVAVAGKIASWHQEEERKRREAQRQAEKEERERREREALEAAEAAQAAGDREAADAILEEATTAPVHAPPPPPTPTVAGTSFRQGWEFEIVKPDLLKRDFLMADEKAIRAAVNRMGTSAHRVVGPGALRIYRKTTVARRR